jgi:hypothetical protein
MAGRIGRGLGDEVQQFGLPLAVDVAVVVKVAHQRQRPLVGRKGRRARSRMGVHEQQVDGVGPDVEHA